MAESMGESLVSQVGLILLLIALAFAVYYVAKFFTGG